MGAVGVDCRKNPQRRAQWEYLSGKVLDVGPDYCREAEEHLSKSVMKIFLNQIRVLKETGSERDAST